MHAAIIDEVDWKTRRISDGPLVHAPARHFSGQGLKRNQTLWGYFLFVTPQEKIYYSGDSGYGPHLRPLANSLALSIWQSWKRSI